MQQLHVLSETAVNCVLCVYGPKYVYMMDFLKPYNWYINLVIGY